MAESDRVRPSATVIVARDAVGEPEIFMVRRHERSSFGAAYAFPGGVVDPEDSLVHDYCDGLTSAEANARLGVEGSRPEPTPPRAKTMSRFRAKSRNLGNISLRSTFPENTVAG